MASSVNLGSQLEGVVDELVKTGRYGSRSEVLREGIRLVQEREARLAALDAAIMRGVADADEGRVFAFDEVVEMLDRRFGPSEERKDD